MMNLLANRAKKFFFGIMISCPLVASAVPVVVESVYGDCYLMEVGADDSFLEIADSIHMLNFESSAEPLTFTVMIPTHVSYNDRIAKKVRPEPRSYAAGISYEECSDIVYIVKTMANSSLPKVKIAESSLRKAGDRIDHVHPFYFLSCIFTNEELKVCMRNMQGRAWVWKGFLNGIVTSLTEEDARDNVLQFADDFAKRVKVDVKAIMPYLKEKRWEKLVDTLIEIVPREGGSDRYNM